MKKLLLALAISFLPSLAFAQCTGIFGPNTICGSVPGGVPGPVPNSVLTGVPGGTNGQIQFNNGGAFGGFTPGGDLSFTNPNFTIINNAVTTPKINAAAVTNPKINAGAAGTVKSSTDGINTTDNPILSFITNTVCVLTPTACGTFFNYYSPIWYGAVCDGVTHDEVAFQNALNAAVIAGKFLQIPGGVTCVLNASITASTTFSSVLIRGSGESSQIFFLGNFGFNFTANAAVYVLDQFSVNCQTTSVAACLSITHASQSTAEGSFITRVRINQSGAIGINLQNTGQITVENCIIQSNSTSGNAALKIDNSQTADVGPNVIKDNTITVIAGATVYGIYALNFGGEQIIDNNIGGYSYDIYSDNNLVSGAATGMLHRGNQLDNYFIAGIYYNSAGAGGSIAHVAIVGNTMHAAQTGSGSIGIIIQVAPGSVHWGTNVAIVGNTVDTFSGGGGISVHGTDDFTIVGNSIHDEGTPTGVGVTTGASSSNCMVMGNVVTQYGTHFTNTAACAISGGTN